MHYLKQRMYKLVLGAIAVLSAGSALGGIGVSPLKQDVIVERGKTQTFCITVVNNVRDGKGKAQPVRVELMDFSVSREGALSFHEPNTREYSASGWIRIAEPSFVLKPGTRKKVECEITAPWTASGEYYSCLMIMPGERGPEKGLTVQYRIASGIFVTVPGRLYQKTAQVLECAATIVEIADRGAADAEIDRDKQDKEDAADADDAGAADAEIDRDKEDKEDAAEADDADAIPPPIIGHSELRVTATIANKGRISFVASGEARVCDAAGRIWARFPLKSRRASVQPGDLRDFSGTFAEPLPAGEYLAKLVFDYGSEWKKARAEAPFSISPEQARLWQHKRDRATTHTTALHVEPVQITQELAAGGFRTVTMKVSNLEPFPVNVTAELTEGGMKTGKEDTEETAEGAEQGGAAAAGGRLREWVCLRPESFTLAENGNRTVMLAFKVPRDAEGEHRGSIQLTVRDMAGEKLTNEPISVPLTISIK